MDGSCFESRKIQPHQKVSTTNLPSHVFRRPVKSLSRLLTVFFANVLREHGSCILAVSKEIRADPDNRSREGKSCNWPCVPLFPLTAVCSNYGPLSIVLPYVQKVLHALKKLTPLVNGVTWLKITLSFHPHYSKNCFQR